jgi:hypothetical protein
MDAKVELVPYRPSNGSEGEWFRSMFCDRCALDKNEDCEILAKTFYLDVDDPEYPKEWVADEKYENPTCTAFTAKEPTP